MTSAHRVAPDKAAPSPRGDPDPYPNYAWLRSRAPVSPLYSPNGVGKTWFVTSYDLGRDCLADSRLSNDDRNSSGHSAPFPEAQYDLSRGLLDLDRPAHARLRRLVTAAFTSSAVTAMRPMMKRVCSAAIDAFSSERLDLVSQFSVPIPVGIIHEVLGVPPEERDDAHHCLDLFYRAGFTQPLDGDCVRQLVDYVRHIADFKRGNPGPDLTTQLLEQRARGELTSDDEVSSMLLSVLGAGHVTTVQFLGTAIIRLLENPNQLAQLRNLTVDWQTAVLEMLRYDSPVQASVYRYATENFTLADVSISRGDAVLVSIGAANRDPARFEDPETFQVDRKGPSNLAFGHGAHLCLGAQLAQIEGEIALQELFGRYPDMTPASPLDEIKWAYAPMLRGPRKLPINLGSRAQ